MANYFGFFSEINGIEWGGGIFNSCFVLREGKIGKDISLIPVDNVAISVGGVVIGCKLAVEVINVGYVNVSVVSKS